MVKIYYLSRVSGFAIILNLKVWRMHDYKLACAMDNEKRMKGYN